MLLLSLQVKRRINSGSETRDFWNKSIAKTSAKRQCLEMLLRNGLRGDATDRVEIKWRQRSFGAHNPLIPLPHTNGDILLSDLNLIHF